MNLGAAESEILSGLTPELEAEGYEVFLQPAPPLTPAFLGDVRPDAIAIRGDKKLLIEIVRSGAKSERRLSDLNRLVSEHPGWELRVILVSPSSTPEPVPVQSPTAIRNRIAETERLLAQGFAGAAFLLGWATFEAVSRALMTDEFRTAQTPGRLIEVLAASGFLTPSEADQLRQLSKSRNALVHGELAIDIRPSEVHELAEILGTLVSMVERGSPNP